MKKKFLGILGALVLLGTVANAHAALITGSTNIFGNANPVGDLPNATGVSFDWGIARGGDGDLAALNGVDTDSGLNLFNFTFDPLSPETTIWSSSDALGGFTFQLDTVTVLQTGTTLTLDGMGILSGIGFDNTSARFALTMNLLSGQLTGSMSSGVAAVPLPGTALLFGSALFGLAAAARRKASRRERTEANG